MLQNVKIVQFKSKHNTITLREGTGVGNAYGLRNPQN